MFVFEGGIVWIGKEASEATLSMAFRSHDDNEDLTLTSGASQVSISN
jgi:hypothetical protein